MSPDTFVAAVESWRTFPSDYEVALMDRWLKSHLDGEHDVEARIALAVYAQREHLARLYADLLDQGETLKWCETHRARATSAITCDRAVTTVTPGDEVSDSVIAAETIGPSAAALQFGVSRQTIWNRRNLLEAQDCVVVDAYLVVRMVGV